MLIMFRAKNYASFKNDVVLDMRKTTYREHLDHVTTVDSFDLLKTVSIYGANASGKSNLISSIAVFQEIIQNHFFDEKQNADSNEDRNKQFFKIKPFAFSENQDDDVEFEMVFYNKRLFQYGFVINKNIIKSEWLLVNNEVVYERSVDNIEYGENYKEILEKYSRHREDRLYLSILDYFSSENEIRNIMDLFKDYFNRKLNLYFEIIFESTIKGSVSGVRFSRKLENDELFRRKVVEYLQQIDTGIQDLIIDEEIIKSSTSGEEKNKKIMKTVHKIYDDNGNCVGTKSLDLRYESSGTLRFLSFIQEILNMIESGGVFIVDELSSRLHPILTKFIVDIFQSEGNISTQLIFTTHDTSLMNKKQFRRDEIVLVDKNDEGISRIYSLSDLEIRKDASFEKDYFNGKYGAIPIIKSYNILECIGEDGKN